MGSLLLLISSETGSNLAYKYYHWVFTHLLDIYDYLLCAIGKYEHFTACSYILETNKFISSVLRHTFSNLISLKLGCLISTDVS